MRMTVKSDVARRPTGPRTYPAGGAHETGGRRAKAQLTRVTSPPVICTNSSNDTGNTACGVPAAAHTVSTVSYTHLTLPTKA